MRRLSETPRAIVYESGTTPIGDKSVTLHRSNIAQPKVTRELTAGAMGDILKEAWLGSSWLKESFRDPLTHNVAKKAAETSVEPAAVRISKTALAAYSTPRRSALWAAAVEGYLNNPVAFSYVAQDVSGNVFEKALKRLVEPSKEYAKISDANVIPKYQGKGLGAMLFDAALHSVHDKDQIPTTYTPSHNKDLIAKLGGLGFEVTGTQDRTDLLRGLTVSEARLQAPSVAYVQSALHEMYPWLNDGEIVS